MLFVLAVLSSTQSITVGLVQSALLLTLALIALRFFRKNRQGLLRGILICLLAGVALRLFNSIPTQVTSDSLIALAITIEILYLVGPPLARLAASLQLGVAWQRLHSRAHEWLLEYGGAENEPAARGD